MKKIITAVIILLFARLPGTATGNGGGTSFKFLQIPPSARAAALGGAGTADADEISGFWYNPAVVAERDSYELSFMYNSYFEGVNQQNFSAGLKNNWGFSMNYLDLGDFDRTTLTNPSGNDLNGYGGSDIAVAAGYGRRFGEISAGMSVKYVREEIDGTYAQTACLDGGVLYDIPRRIKYAGGTAVGLSVRNIGEKAEFVTEEEALPAELRMGIKRKVKAADILTVSVLADTVKTFGEG
ncbi:MAG: PorV/PorQ family protein, partial [Elusimicrobiota bacterium]|nr:PorV/PorQ family protein [Elusimicrobiota bacterium]